MYVCACVCMFSHMCLCMCMCLCHGVCGVGSVGDSVGVSSSSSRRVSDGDAVLLDQHTRRTSEYVALREKYVALPVKKIIVFGG
jgi:hypothetical protein